MERPIGIDLFAGAGGMSLGFEQAGYDVLAAIEIDPVHAAVHSYNFPHCAVIAHSVDRLSAEYIREQAGIGDRKVDVVFGGAPCQGFSLIGARQLDDPRNLLVREFVRLVHELNADHFVFENVKGITVGKHKQFLQEIISAFSECGYEVRHPWKVLNATEYGVPQHRERLFLMGSKRGLNVPDYPSPISSRAGKPNTDLTKGPSCEEALGDLPDAESFDELLVSDTATVTFGPPSDYVRSLRGLSNDTDDFSHPRIWDPAVLTCSGRTDHTAISRRRFAETPQGTVEPISRFYKLSANGVSNTLRAGTDSARGAFTSPRPIHYKHARCITVREMARLHGFPDWFRFHVTKWHGARQIGNAVPPPLARAVASQVMVASGKGKVRPNEAIQLGDVGLLSKDMTEAAAYFSVSVPIGKRDRKGAPKRRQWDDDAQENKGSTLIGK